MKGFSPKLLGFLCNWCAYAGADLSGVSRVQYPHNIRVIRVMCSGRVDPLLVLKSLKYGIDGVAVLGCHPGDCHYQTGNYYAENKMKFTQHVLNKIGIEPERLYLDWVSAAEGVRFGEVITNFTNQIKKLGPLKNIKEYKDKLSLGESIVKSERLRWLVGKERELIELGNVYQEKIDENRFDNIILQNIATEYNKERIQLLIKKSPQSVNDIASKLNISKSTAFKYLVDMENQGLISFFDFMENSPRYTVLLQEDDKK
jgi:coenzyme F420-reducing hydrogenase delta subunit